MGHSAAAQELWSFAFALVGHVFVMPENVVELERDRKEFLMCRYNKKKREMMLRRWSLCNNLGKVLATFALSLLKD